MMSSKYKTSFLHLRYTCALLVIYIFHIKLPLMYKFYPKCKNFHIKSCTRGNFFNIELRVIETIYPYS